MTLYYSEPGVEVHCGRVEDVLATIDPRGVALLSADVPYGNGDEGSRVGQVDGRPRKSTTAAKKARMGKARAWKPIEGNSTPFDPAQLLAFGRPAVLWGANHYASRLPDSKAWIVWDKRDGTVSDDGADAELAWTNYPGALRTFRHAWRGLARASETGERHLHPTQKPVALYHWLFSWRTKPGDLIVAPYAGSGPDVLAARNLGRRIIAIEIDEIYCAEIVERLRQPMLPIVPPLALAAAPQLSLIDNK